MKKLRSVAFVLGVVLCLTAGAQNSQTRSTTIEPLPRDLEIELASSSLPPHLRNNMARDRFGDWLRDTQNIATGFVH